MSVSTGVKESAEVEDEHWNLRADTHEHSNQKHVVSPARHNYVADIKEK